MNEAKLKIAANEIREILEKYDIAAAIVLHAPGASEYFLKLNPSYSCAQIVGDELKLKSRLYEDFFGIVENRDKALANTANMLHLLSTTTATISFSLIEISEGVDKLAQVDHIPKKSNDNELKN